MMDLSNFRHPLPAAVQWPIGFDFDQSSGVLLCSITVPDFAQLRIVKRRGKSYVSRAGAEGTKRDGAL